MKNIKRKIVISLALFGSLLITSTPAFAYLGPGAGLGMIGSLIAVVVVGLVIVLGLVVYPIKVWRKRKAQSFIDKKNAESSGYKQ